MNILLACSQNWFEPKFDENNFLNIQTISKKNELNRDFLKAFNPKYIFFPHWNWIVPPEIYLNYECIVFHTAPLPCGRGGSPIQNLIRLDYKTSPVCALRMNEIIDGGDIYLSREVSLKGNINEIFSRIEPVIKEFIVKICSENIVPKKQKGEVTNFKRLLPEDNELNKHYSLKRLYDEIRMVDGLDYPRAHIYFGDNKIEFFNAKLKNGELLAEIRISKKE